jgi:hypothetical protein
MKRKIGWTMLFAGLTLSLCVAFVAVVADIRPPMRTGQFVVISTPMAHCQDYRLFPILPRTAVAINATATTYVKQISAKGATITRMILEVPNYTNSVTTTFNLLTAAGVTQYASAAFAKNSNYTVPMWQEVFGKYNCQFVLSGAAGGSGGTMYVTLLGSGN